MSEKQDYIVNADGWVAGKRCSKGSIVSLTADEAKYENVTLKKGESLADQAKAETAKRSRAKK